MKTLGIKCNALVAKNWPTEELGEVLDVSLKIFCEHESQVQVEGRFFTDDELVQLLMDFHNYLTHENHKLPGSHVLFSMYLKSRGFE